MPYALCFPKSAIRNPKFCPIPFALLLLATGY
jgi:hypothetical protein